ncbi:aminotransferase class I/II-fold pyridoxal phosphate-dependent enzyme [Phormidium sp. CLA17]|uniref:aminotransferase class I/II-fold pyridoxal phosphate-dependent enzyme n=1 Tax=Leptolyngbya sp. Cla-17 TaxID=2803751 RepID=UPI001492999A|nr:aminotransferase class I/II-fold pyridoxal phosphate-dependent enzyme [Leptolyngbya sp. Cla-17]MBM0742317.1 aminotransferase class I/II-fold pyridoxal phosphate-dependent enzyme [Leptolyngbya sp. Cla-17]
MSSQFHSQAELPLVEALRHCANRLHAPFYTPGHKRGQGVASPLKDLLGEQVFRADLPELPELDNLFAPESVILAAQELAAAAFGADRTWFLANGSTSGVIAAILATCNPGDILLLPRTVHQSAISGLILSGAVPVFINPDYDPALDIAHSITPAAVTTALANHPTAKAVLMVSPTYYGACGDVSAIAQVAHHHGIPLIVDEAHGAHFAFHADLPRSALKAGADVAVQSTHKTLSALTQAAMVHVQGDLVDRDRLSKSLALVQSTSPNYLLLASLDAARWQMATQGEALMTHTLHLAEKARSQISQIPKLATLSHHHATTPGFVDFDATRLTVTVSGLGIDGFTADDILNTKLSVTAEFPSLQHLTFIISLGNTTADMNQLVSAFKQLAQECRVQSAECGVRSARFLSPIPCSLPSLSPREAFFAATETVAIADANHRISAELVCPYPPGIPVLIPGEVVTETAIAYLQKILASGGILSGCSDASFVTLKVVKA